MIDTEITKIHSILYKNIESQTLMKRLDSQNAELKIKILEIVDFLKKQEHQEDNEFIQKIQQFVEKLEDITQKEITEKMEENALKSGENSPRKKKRASYEKLTLQI